MVMQLKTKNMVERLKRWESPRKRGRNDKGKGGSARARQLRKREQMLRQKLKKRVEVAQKPEKLKREGREIIPSLFFGQLSLYCSVTEKSDIDILITFKEKADSKKYFGVLFYLEDLLNCPVDLITETSLRPELQPYVDAEKIDV